MSNQAITWAYAQITGHGPGCKAVLVALADMADESNSCFPGQGLLAQRTEQNERTVRTHLKHLEEDGFILRAARFDEKGHRTSDRYMLPVQVQTGSPAGRKNRRKNQPPAESTGGQIQQSPPADFVETTGRETRVTLREPKVEPSVTDASARRVNINEAFDAFWAVYPRHTAKGASIAKFKRAVDKVGLDVVMAGVRRLAEDPNLPEEQFVPHASTWLHQERWSDGPLPARNDRRAVVDPPSRPGW